MDSFNFFQPTRLVFGGGKLENIAEIMKPYGKRCLIISSRKEGALSKVYREIIGRLEKADIETWHYDGVRPNPTTGQVEEANSIVREKNIKVLLAVGGGSSMDAAKAVAVTARYSRVDWNTVFESYSDPFSKYNDDDILPLVTVNSIAGTGSHITQAAVITITEKKSKCTLFHNQAIPVESIIDPNITINMPPGITSVTGFDAFTHAFESYLSPLASPYTALLALESMAGISLANTGGGQTRDFRDY